MREPVILVVDDDDEDRMILRECFEDAGIKGYQFFENAEAILNYLRKQKHPERLPKIIVSDQNMPGMTGIELLRFLKKDPGLEDIDVVIFSTNGNTSFIRECMKDGASAYFQKPDSYSELKKISRSIAVMAENKE